jgi:hypothetical protein
VCVSAKEREREGEREKRDNYKKGQGGLNLKVVQKKKKKKKKQIDTKHTQEGIRNGHKPAGFRAGCGCTRGGKVKESRAGYISDPQVFSPNSAPSLAQSVGVLLLCVIAGAGRLGL